MPSAPVRRLRHQERTQTPFFVNTGFYRTGTQLKRLEYYAQAIQAKFGTDFEVLFGPAYKGIPLSVTTAVALSSLYGKDIRYCSNRKEIKDHGDKGILLGGPVNDGDRVVIIEDVTTAGTSIRETLPIIQDTAKASVLGLVVSVDRCERGTGEKSALDEIHDTFGIETCAIVTMKDVVEHLYGTVIDDAMKEKIDAYYQLYGCE